MNEFVQFFDLCANYHFKPELVLEELAADFRDGFLKEAGRANDKNALDKSREERLEIKIEVINRN